MKRLCLVALIAGISLNAHAVGRLADVSIIDRVSGNEIPTHFYRGEYWVAGAPGARYAVLIRNSLGERVLAVTAVDGVNAISGDTASWDQTGYVFAPRQQYQIAGWRKSNAEVAAFEFTAISNAYATHTGRPQNVGVIGVALFRERKAAIAESEPRASRLQAPWVPAPSPSAEASATDRALPSALSAGVPQSLGTGHGQLEYSRVYDVDFERLHTAPDEVVRIRYDSLQNLVAMGVVRQPQQPLTTPNPFPNSPLARYVPDPPELR
jgi:hypothetical protein